MPFKQFPRAALFILACLIFSGCSLNDKQLKAGWWKYGEGFHLEDIVDFNNGYSIHQDTIFQNGKIAGIITKRTKGIFGVSNKIEITSPSKKETGVYHQKGL